MARPAHTSSDDTRRRLLDAAIQRFAAGGFSGASTRDIAQAARVTMATIRYYFRGKQGLYDAAIDDVYRRLRERVTEALGGGAMSLDGIVERVYDAARKERDGVRVLLREVLDQGQLSERTEARHFLPGLENTVAAAQQLLGFPPEHARAAMVALSYLVSRYALQDERSLARAFGVPTVRQAHQHAVDTIVATARGLLASVPGGDPRRRDLDDAWQRREMILSAAREHAPRAKERK